MSVLIPNELVEERIFLIRDHKVMIDRDLAQLYGVETKYLNRQVRRNINRFPDEFMFQLTIEEKNELVTNWHRFESLKHSSNLPFCFTEHGVAMLASVLNSERAVKMSIHIVKTFVKLRKVISTHKELAAQLEKLENIVEQHDSSIKAIFEAIQQMLAPPEKSRRKIGYKTNGK